MFDKKVYNKKYREQNADKVAEYQRRYYEADKEKKRQYNRQHQAKNRERYRGYAIASHQRIRLEILTRYSKDKPECACCGEQEIKFLGIDHINGRENEPVKRTGRSFYLFLLRTAYDDNLQVLCHNCNYAKGFYKQCPHASRA
jgi:hypothetical protein